MARGLIGLVFGIIAGGITVMLVESISSLMYPRPEGMAWDDLEAMKEFVASLPMPAFLIVLVAHVAGAFVAGFVCYAVSKKASVWFPLGLGGFFLLGGAMNLVSIPHPIWFAVADLVIYVPSAWLGHLSAGKSFGATASNEAETVETTPNNDTN